VWPSRAKQKQKPESRGNHLLHRSSVLFSCRCSPRAHAPLTPRASCLLAPSPPRSPAARRASLTRHLAPRSSLSMVHRGFCKDYFGIPLSRGIRGPNCFCACQPLARDAGHAFALLYCARFVMHDRRGQCEASRCVGTLLFGLSFEELKIAESKASSSIVIINFAACRNANAHP
jgi:hypothetical protein